MTRAHARPWYEGIPLTELCANCGMRSGLHRGSDGKCPPANEREPGFPRRLGDAAFEVYDQRLARYWEKTKTTWRKAR